VTLNVNARAHTNKELAKSELFVMILTDASTVSLNKSDRVHENLLWYPDWSLFSKTLRLFIIAVSLLKQSLKKTFLALPLLFLCL